MVLTATLPSTACAPSDGLELAICAQQARLQIVLTNRTSETLRVYFVAGKPNYHHHDFLTVSLNRGHATRTLRFTGNRNGSTIGLVELGAGEQIADEIDLLAWAIDPINGATAVAPGEYALTVSYRVAQSEAWSGEITAGPICSIVG